MQRIRMSENFRAAFYGPFYATLELGYFADEGLDVELVNSATPGSATAGLVDGSLDVSWGGPMRVMKDRNEHPGVGLTAFCEVVRRDPFYLVAQPRLPTFKLQDLATLRFASVSEVPTPWLCLQHDLRELGIDPARIDRIPDRTMDANLAALGEGTLDVAQMFEPFAARAEREGKGRIVHAASARGETSYTTFLATRDGIARRRDALSGMTRAIARMQAWLTANGAGELARLVAPYYPQIAKQDLERAYIRYLDAGLWATDTTISPTGFDRLAQSLKTGGFIETIPAYADCVANLQ
ncbi:MAG: ABC transporter substrate-binding protein [Hyphomicrobiaceae bacterium]